MSRTRGRQSCLYSLFAACLALLILFGPARAAIAQASIGPDLPNAPLYHRRTLLIFPGYETVHQIDGLVPKLSVRQKFELSYRKTVDPSFLAQSLLFALASQPGYYGPQYGPGLGPYGERLGYYSASLATSNLISGGVMSSLLHQDPRYFRKGTGSVLGRTWWAMRSNFVARGDNGHEEINGSKIIGYALATPVTGLYAPNGLQGFQHNAASYGTKFGINFVANLFREFGGFSDRTRDPHVP